MVLLVYTNYISVDLAHHEIFCAKIGNGGINSFIWWDSHFLAKRALGLLFSKSFGSSENMLFFQPKMLSLPL